MNPRVCWAVAGLILAATGAAGAHDSGLPLPSPDLASDTSVPVARAGAPRPRHKPTIVYDSRRGRLVMFSGLAGTEVYEDVWTMPLDAPGVWKRLETRGAAPAGRFGHTAIYDPAGDRMIVFGGNVPGRGPDDAVWELRFSNGPTWLRMTPSGAAPSARFAHTAVYDPARGRMIVFGGFDGRYENDVWALSLGIVPSWSRLVPAGPAPAGRNAHVAVLDLERRRMIVQGGFDGTTSRDDTWALALTRSLRWERIATREAPPPRRQHAAAYDPFGDRMLIFGGTVNGADAGYGDVWALSLAGAPSWRELEPAGKGPAPRWGPALAWAPECRCVYVFGGTSRTGWFNDTWRLGLSPDATWEAAR